MTYLVEALDRHVLTPMAEMLQQWSAPMPYGCRHAAGIDSTAGSWCLSPKQHLLEFFAINTIFSWAISTLFNVVFGARESAVNLALEKRMHRLLPAGDGSRRFEYVLGFLVAASLATVAAHKIIRGTLLFMLQPCHVHAMGLLVILFSDPRNTTPHVLFNYYLHATWAGIIALLFPDLRQLDLPFEFANFWIEHALLVLVPVILLLRGNHVVFPCSIPFSILTFIAKASYHALVLGPMALATGKNLNYMLMPPPGPLEHFGRGYRVIMYAFCCLMSVATRHVLFAPLVKHHRDQGAQDKRAADKSNKMALLPSGFKLD